MTSDLQRIQGIFPDALRYDGLARRDPGQGDLKFDDFSPFQERQKTPWKFNINSSPLKNGGTGR